jgi:hypothetical protein
MHKQHGLTMIGFLACAVIAVAVVLLGLEVVPAYTEYRGIKNAVKLIAEDSQITTVRAARESFSKRAQAGYISSLNADDLVISQEGGGVAISFNYEKQIKLFANASLVLEFNGDTRNKK